MRMLIVAGAVALVLTGCSGGGGEEAGPAQVSERTRSEANRPPPVPDPHFTGFPYLVDVKVGRDGTKLYVVQRDRPARFLKHGMARFLEQIRFGRASKYNGNPDPVVVRLLDGEGRKVWWAGHRGNEGWVGAATPELDACSPIGHSQPVRLDPVTHKPLPSPRCPAG